VTATVIARRATMGAASFINSVNTDYEALHKSFEEQFWGTKQQRPCSATW